MIASKRKLYILEQLSSKGIISIKDTAKELGTSEITIRRDFEKLEQEGNLKRVQGGAALTNDNNEKLDSAELTVRKKKILNLPEKKVVAKYAADFVKDGDCVFVDTGTTMIPLMNYLCRKNIFIVTNNTLVIQDIVNPIAEIFVVGGKYIPTYGMNVGSIAQETITTFHFDYAFFGCAGVNLDSGDIYTSEMESFHIKHIALNNCNHSILLVDSSKLQKQAFVKLASTHAMEHILCDDSPVLDHVILPENFSLVKL